MYNSHRTAQQGPHEGMGTPVRTGTQIDFLKGESEHSVINQAKAVSNALPLLQRQVSTAWRMRSQPVLIFARETIAGSGWSGDKAPRSLLVIQCDMGSQSVQDGNGQTSDTRIVQLQG